MLFFFFSSRRRHTRSLCDWSSDVCSSDLDARGTCRFLPLPARPTSVTFVPASASPSTDRHGSPRSEERRVGKECRSRWSPYQYKKRMDWDVLYVVAVIHEIVLISLAYFSY